MKNIIKNMYEDNLIRYKNENNEENNSTFFESENNNEEKIDIENNDDENGSIDSFKCIDNYLTAIFDLENGDDPSLTKEKDIKDIDINDKYRKTILCFHTKNNNLNAELELGNTYEYESMEKEKEYNYNALTKTLSIENHDSLDKEMNTIKENNLKLKKAKTNLDGTEQNFLEKEEILNNYYSFKTKNYIKKNEENFNFPKNYSENAINKRCYEMVNTIYEGIEEKNNLSKIDDNMLKNVLSPLDEKNIEENIIDIRKNSVNNANNDKMEDVLIKNKNDILNQNLSHLLNCDKEFIYSYFSNQFDTNTEEFKETFNIEKNEISDKTSNMYNSNNKFQGSLKGNNKEHKKIDNERAFNIYEKNRNMCSDFSYLDEDGIINHKSHKSYINNAKENEGRISLDFGNSELYKNNSHTIEQFQDNFNNEMNHNNFSQINNNNYKGGHLNKNFIFTSDTNNNKNIMCYTQLNQNEVFTSNVNNTSYPNMSNTNSNVKNSTQKKNTLNNADLMVNPLKYSLKLRQKKDEKKNEFVEENMNALYSKILFSKNPILNMNKICLNESYNNYEKNNFNLKNSDSEFHQSLLTFLNNENYSIDSNIRANYNMDVIPVENKIYNNKNDDSSDLSFQNNYDEFYKPTNRNRNIRRINDNINFHELKSKDVLEKNDFSLEKNYLKYSLNSHLDSNINENNFKKGDLFNETFNRDEKNKGIIFEILKNKIKTLLENEDDHLLSEHLIDILNDYNMRKYNNGNSMYNGSFKNNEKIDTLNKSKINYSEHNDIVNYNSYSLNKEFKKIECDENFNVLQNMKNDEMNNSNENHMPNKSKLSYEIIKANNSKEISINNILCENKSNICNTNKSINTNDLSLFLNNNHLMNKNSNQYTSRKNIKNNNIEDYINHYDEFNKMNELGNLSFFNSSSFNSQNNNQRTNFGTDGQIVSEKYQIFNSLEEGFQNLEKNTFRNKKNFNYNSNNENYFSYKLKNIKEDNNLKKNKNLLSGQFYDEKEGIYQNAKETHYEKTKNSSYKKNKGNITDKNSSENNYIDNTFKNNDARSNSTGITNQEKEKVFEYLQKYSNYVKSSKESTIDKFKSEKYNSIPNKVNYYLKSESVLNDKYKSESSFNKNSYLRNGSNWGEKTFNEDERNKFFSCNKESNFPSKNQKKFDKIWSRNNYLKKSTKTNNNEQTIEDIKQKLKSKNTIPNLKLKKQRIEIKVLTPEEIKSLLTEEDERDLEKLLQSLYDDRILPLLFNLKGRAEEFQYKDVIKNNIKTAYSLYPEKYLVKKNNSADDYVIYFVNKKVQDNYFLSINNLKDVYDPYIWREFEKYLEEIANSEDPSLYTFSGGRYGMAKELKRRNLPFFRGLYLGELCHIVHISTNKKIIAYENNYLKPISQCHKYTNAKMGIVNTHGTDMENYITTMDELRLYLNELLKYYKGGFNISTLKKKLKNRFNKQICESVFHCIKLIEVLQLDGLKDICTVDKESKIVKSAKDIW
ncbi:conserved Plasmodium protein, unknown function [Plasmodium relictum]|uniref:HTH OST-type domain-containing protein n=1 Tax=Plasmodium relictum TaxID=85471 RepID=A0A1J1HI43_PLARL|nr:conserved Plasmodium protein, unknown function [Plasmodium relictum]CRH03941.1 conserved Plasmodium protein, unknown function [Plasmodium relictum]